MNRPLMRFGLAGGLALLVACASWGQAPPPSSSTPPSQPSGSGGNRGNNNPQPDRGQQDRDSRLPLYVEGRVINENGQQLDDAVSIGLNCGMRTLQTIKTDIGGYFRFALGLGAQANADFSAADQAAPSSISSGMNLAGGYSGFGIPGNSLAGCDIRISVPGYVPLDLPVMDQASLGTIDVGVLELQRVGKVPSGSVSATSLLAPENARKEFEQGVKDLRSNRLSRAKQHLQRAVGAYDKYAAAWTELGTVYAAGHEMDKARQAWGKAVAADSKYVPPYVSLGAAQMENEDYDGALESIAQAVEVDPTITRGLAGYIQGFANFRLNRMDAAQESLLQAEKGPHPSTPQLHVLLAELYLRQQDSVSAAAHMRAYIKEAPEGSFAVEMRRLLAEIDQAVANDGSSGDRSVIAP